MKHKINIEMTVEFEDYPTKKMNLAAKRQIRRWVKETLDNCAGYIPFYVESDENGASIEGCTRRTKTKLKS